MKKVYTEEDNVNYWKNEYSRVLDDNKILREKLANLERKIKKIEAKEKPA